MYFLWWHLTVEIYVRKRSQDANCLCQPRPFSLHQFHFLKHKATAKTSNKKNSNSNNNNSYNNNSNNNKSNNNNNNSNKNNSNNNNSNINNINNNNSNNNNNNKNNNNNNNNSNKKRNNLFPTPFHIDLHLISSPWSQQKSLDRRSKVQFVPHCILRMNLNIMQRSIVRC